MITFSGWYSCGNKFARDCLLLLLLLLMLLLCLIIYGQENQAHLLPQVGGRLTLTVKVIERGLGAAQGKGVCVLLRLWYTHTPVRGTSVLSLCGAGYAIRQWLVSVVAGCHHWMIKERAESGISSRQHQQ